MFTVQILLMAFGVVGGLVLAYWLRGQPWDAASRARAALAFGAGAMAWVGFAAIALPPPFAWIFLGTVVALYLPPMLVILSAGTIPANGDQGP